MCNKFILIAQEKLLAFNSQLVALNIHFFFIIKKLYKNRFTKVVNNSILLQSSLKKKRIMSNNF